MATEGGAAPVPFCDVLVDISTKEAIIKGYREMERHLREEAEKTPFDLVQAKLLQHADRVRERRKIYVEKWRERYEG